LYKWRSALQQGVPTKRQLQLSKRANLPSASTAAEACRRQHDLADAGDAAAERLGAASPSGGQEVGVEVVDDDSKRKRLLALWKKVRLVRDWVKIEMAKGSERAASVK
jgi:hypothetical protein